MILRENDIDPNAPSDSFINGIMKNLRIKERYKIYVLSSFAAFFSAVAFAIVQAEPQQFLPQTASLVQEAQNTKKQGELKQEQVQKITPEIAKVSDGTKEREFQKQEELKVARSEEQKSQPNGDQLAYGQESAKPKMIQPENADDRKSDDKKIEKNKAHNVEPNNSAVKKVSLAGKVSRISLVANKSEIIELEVPYVTALIGNETIADVIAISNKSIYILGKKIGATRLTVLDSDKQPIGIIEIEVSYDIAHLKKQYRELLPKSNIEVRSINGRLMLTGRVPDAVSLQEAVTLAEQFAPGAVTNSISVDSPQQVMLEVRFVEANREAGKELGVGWNVIANKFVGSTLLNTVSNPGAAVGEGVGSLLKSGLPTGNTPFGSAVVGILNGGTQVDLLIQALEKKNLARKLAEPNLTTLSGVKAHFLAGGEYPYPVIGQDGIVGTNFKKFGVGLDFTPTVLADGLINLQIEPEVSDLIPGSGVLVNGVQVPTIVVRRAQTTIELRDGQSFAIAGLLQSDHNKIQNQLPVLGSIPILGALFRSASFQRKETDLVIIVTPRLVKPVKPGQQLATPLDDVIATNEIDFFLTGKQERLAPKGPVSGGHIIRADNHNAGDHGEKGHDYQDAPLEKKPSSKDNDHVGAMTAN